MLSIWTIWDGLRQKTISRYCPFKSTESIGFFILEYLYEKFLSLIRTVPVPKDFLLKSAEFEH